VQVNHSELLASPEPSQGSRLNEYGDVGARRGGGRKKDPPLCFVLIILIGALVGGAANSAHSHQPADRTSPAPGVNEQNDRLTNLVSQIQFYAWQLNCFCFCDGSVSNSRLNSRRSGLSNGVLLDLEGPVVRCVASDLCGRQTTILIVACL
jgi:hypothetical protein